ncbi:MAG: rhodanese-like domain-containing protein [Thermodesulfobacteriota bacterium]
MNSFKLHRWFLVFLIMAVICLSGGCSSGSGAITRLTLHSLVDEGTAPVVVDVRSGGEYAEGHIPGAIHIPFYSVGKRHAEISSDKDSPVVVYCAHGPRAWWASFVLRRKGFSRVAILEGHFKKWQESGFIPDKKSTRFFE